MNTEFNKSKSFFLKLIEKGLILWIKTKCQKIKYLSININGSNNSILKGTISSLYLTGNDIIFQDFQLNDIDLRTGPIDIIIIKGFKITIKNNFNIYGSMRFSENSISKTLLSNRFYSITQLISNKFLGMEYLEELKINKNLLEIRASNKNGDYSSITNLFISEFSDTLLISNQDKSKSIILPMDESIKIKNALLKEGYLIIKFEAKVNPL